MSLFGNVREASLSFVSEDVQYKLKRAWTNEDVLDLALNPLKIRDMISAASYQKWRAKHGTREQIDQFTKDSLSTLGVPGDSVYDLLAVLSDDNLYPLLEADLWSAGIAIEDVLSGAVPIRRVVAVFMGFPESCAWKRQLNKPHSEWGTAEFMLAEIADLLNFQVQLQHITAQVGGWQPKGKTKVPEPIFLRPGEERKKVKMDKTADLISLMKARRHG